MTPGHRLVASGIAGLDLLLGGGIPLVRRVPGAPTGGRAGESVTMLIRGGPGAGKTILGAQLARALATELRSYVVFACIEILPEELRIQQSQLMGKAAPRVHVPTSGGWSEDASNASSRDFLASVLDRATGEAGAGVVADSLEPLLESAARRTGAPPRVLVLDSLSDGYGLGRAASRELVDAVMKLAAKHDLGLILLEETVDLDLTAWSFAADVVLELIEPEEELPYERRLRVRKNRFGGTVGTNSRFSIISGIGVEVYPATVAYRTPWGRALAEPHSSAAARRLWGLRAEPPLMSLNASDAVLVAEPHPGWAWEHVLRSIALRAGDDSKVEGASLVVRTGREGLPTEQDANTVDLPLRPMLSRERWLSIFLRKVSANRPVARVVMLLNVAELIDDGVLHLRDLLATMLDELSVLGVPAIVVVDRDARSFVWDLFEYVIEPRANEASLTVRNVIDGSETPVAFRS